MKEIAKSYAFEATILSGLPVQVGEVPEREGAHVVEGLRHSVVRLGHHSPEERKQERSMRGGIGREKELRLYTLWALRRTVTEESGHVTKERPGYGDSYLNRCM